MTIKLIHLQGLLVTLTSIVLVPGMVVAASLILGMSNESAGWLRYKLPEVFLWMFLSTGIASPFLGIGTFVFLWILQRQRAPVNSSETDPRIRRALILAAVTVAPVAWTILFGEVSFVAGGNR